MLKAKQLELLKTFRKVHDQQREMYNKKTHRVDDRIVSISQPWVRPIVRGKAQALTEFGIKVHLTLSDDFARLDHSLFDAFNESTLLQDAMDSYRNREGHYPERVLADKICRKLLGESFVLGSRHTRIGVNLYLKRELYRGEIRTGAPKHGLIFHRRAKERRICPQSHLKQRGA